MTGHPFRRGLVVFTVLFVLAPNTAFAQLAHIDWFNPQSGPVGTQVSIFGSGFMDATGVMFTDRLIGQQVFSSFSVVNDTEIHATEPSFLFPLPTRDWLVSVFDGQGGTVSILPGYTNITGNTSAMIGSTTYVVRGGGSLDLDAVGSCTIFVESGGFARSFGGGFETVYVQDGGTYVTGGGSTVFAEPSASLTIGGAGNQVTRLPQVSESFIPEPSAMGALMLASALLLRPKREPTNASAGGLADNQRRVRRQPVNLAPLRDRQPPP